MPDPAWLRATPTAYARGHLARLRARYDDPFGLAVRRMAPVAWLGVPPSAILGQTASVTRANANTTRTSRSQRFHEVGYAQSPAGLRDGPAPNPDPAAKYNRWGELAASPLVVQLLGRPATMVPDGWASALDDQAAVGLASLLKDLASITRKLPPALRPSSPSTRWAVFCAYSAFSRGASGAWSRLAPAADVLAAVDEGARVEALVRWIATSDHPAAKVVGKEGVARMVLRSLWKIASGEALERALGGDAAWYGVRDVDAEAALTRRALGV